MRGEKKVSVHVQVPEAVRGRLEELVTLAEADSMAEVARRSINLFHTLMSESGRNIRLYREEDDGTLTRILLIP